MILRVAIFHGFKNMTATHTEKNAISLELPIYKLRRKFAKADGLTAEAWIEKAIRERTARGDENTRRKFIVSTVAANRIDRLAAQLCMERGELIESLLDRAIRETDNDLAMGDAADESVIAPSLCEDHDATELIDGMTVAEVLAADKRGPGTIQRQHYVVQCIEDCTMPSGNAAKGEKLPPSMANRLREEEEEIQRVKILLASR